MLVAQASPLKRNQQTHRRGAIRGKIFLSRVFMRGAERVIGRVANGHVNPRKHAVNHTVSTLPNFNIAYYLESVQINFEKIPRNFCIRRLIEIYGHE